MTWTHIHLMTNHLPILGAPALLALLAWGLWRRSREIARVALWGTVLLAAFSESVVLTGEAAEDQLEGRPGFSASMVETHEERATAANIAMIITSLVAVAALWRGRHEPAPVGILPRAVLVGLLVSTSLYAIAAWTGGPIGHPEIRPGAVTATGGG